MITILQRKTASLQDEHGQIALIVLLIMAVVLTIGLALASRTIMDVSLSRQEQNGSQAYQAAESGIEDSLNQNLAVIPNGTKVVNGATIGNANVTVTLNTSNTVATRVTQGDAVQVQLTAPGANGRLLRVQWGKGDTACSASLLIRVYNLNGAAYTARNYAVGPTGGCAVANGFAPGTAINVNGYLVQYDIPIIANDRVVSIHPLGADTQLNVAPNGAWALPTQFYTLNSTAVDNSGTETKAITVTKSVPGAPGILDYALYSGNALSQ
jgi:Tfp pilus assembly protein PilX